MIIKPVLSVEEKVGPLLQVDMLLTAQYFAAFGRERRVEPEKRLMLAVLEDAISCFREYISARDGRRRNLFHEAEGWILEENKDWLFSFDNICEALGFELKYLRDELVRWKERKLLEISRADLYRLTRQKQQHKSGGVKSGSTDQRHLRVVGR